MDGYLMAVEKTICRMRSAMIAAWYAEKSTESGATWSRALVAALRRFPAIVSTTMIETEKYHNKLVRTARPNAAAQRTRFARR